MVLSMDELVFTGKVVNGIGKHSELVVPGKSAFQNAPDDWPAKLCPGSLNARITGYPPEFATRRLALSTKTLDIAGFLPAFTIPQAQMGNNKLIPIPAMPVRGTAQLWRALLDANGQSAKCWVLRRFGSGLADQLELVSDIY